MLKGSKRKHSEGADGKDDGGDVSEGLTDPKPLTATEVLAQQRFINKVSDIRLPSFPWSILQDPKMWKIPTDELIADDVYSQQKPLNATSEGLSKRRAALNKMLSKILKSGDWHIKGTPQMSLHDSETGKVVKKLKRRFRPVVKSTKPLPGWRTWYPAQGSSGILLKSISADYIWEGPTATTRQSNDGQPMRVTVNNPAQVSPDDAIHLDYGIYSYKTPELLYNHHGFAVGHIVGRLDNYGHVVEHEHGYRAQKVIIRELWIIVIDKPNPESLSIEDLSARYDCPVHYLPRQQKKGWIKFYSEEALHV